MMRPLAGFPATRYVGLARDGFSVGAALVRFNHLVRKVKGDFRGARDSALSSFPPEIGGVPLEELQPAEGEGGRYRLRRS